MHLSSHYFTWIKKPNLMKSSEMIPLELAGKMEAEASWMLTTVP